MNGILGAFQSFFFNHADDPSRPRVKTAKEIALAEARAKTTILVIDDDPSILEVISPLLKEEGFTVLTAKSGPKGLDLLRYGQKNIKVVLLDYSMPRFSGEETLTYVRKLVPSAKVIALSGIDPMLLPEQYRTSVDRFMSKPFRSADLVNCINELLDLDAEVGAVAVGKA